MVIWLTLLLSFHINAQSLDRNTFDAYFKGFDSEFLEIIDQDSPYFHEPLSPYPFWAKPVQWESIKWSPSGTWGYYTDSCRPDVLKGADAEEIRE